MSINQKNPPSGQKPAAAAAEEAAHRTSPGQQPFQGQNVNQAYNQPSTLSTLFGARSAIPSPISGSPNAAALSSLLETVKLITETTKSIYEVTLLPVSGVDNELPISALVVAIRYKGDAGIPDDSFGVSYHTLLLADTLANDKRLEVPTTFAGKSLTIIRAVGEVYTPRVKEVIDNAVRREFRSVDPSRFSSSGAQTIPRGFDYKNEDLVRSAIDNVLTIAAANLFDSAGANLPDLVLNPATVGDINQNVQVQVSTRQHTPLIDQLGAPVRADIVIELYAGGQQQQQNVNLNSLEVPPLDEAVNQVTLTKVSGFIDFLYDPVEGAGTNNPFAQVNLDPALQATRRLTYRPRLVVTSLESDEMRTLPGQLFALATLPPLFENNVWFTQMKPDKVEGFQLHDIGAIGYEVNDGVRFETRGDSFTEQTLTYLMGAFVRKEPWVSLDVEEAGPSTYWNAIYLAAANGSSEANQQIFNAANILTNGQFASIYKGGPNAVFSDQQRIHLGDYTERTADNKAGGKRDIRDIDYLAVLNTYGDSNIKEVAAWSDTFTDVSIPLEVRNDARWKIINHSTGGSAVFRGYANRVTFNPEFINALVASVKACGVLPRVRTPIQDAQNRPRGVANFQGIQGGMSSTPSGMFNRAFGSQQTYQGGGNRAFTGGFGRWTA